MTPSRVALVTENATATRPVCDWLRESAGVEPLVHSFASVRDILDRDADGVLLLHIARPADEDLAEEVVQEISLLKLAPLVVLLDGDAARVNHQEMNRRIARRLSWPADADTLLRLVQEMSRAKGFSRDPDDALEDLLSRRLLAWTPSLLPLVDRIALAACHEVTVLLNGETGTGKTFLARLIHEYSPRKTHRFLTVPCGAISANLVESEFFGHVKGAFTGADRPKIGKFAAVAQGTLLLDEIDTLGLEQQATLLRVIE
ncbi:MAG: sigma 54-interacting transcriptional regulator, partial [Gemmataceae bacterium]